LVLCRFNACWSTRASWAPTHELTAERTANGGTPREFADVYGSVWGTAGTGSVLLLDGKARGLAGPMAGVRAVQRAFGWLFTGRTGFPWPYGGWDLPWLLHVPEVRPWETGPAGTWGNRVDNTGGYRDDDWLAESFGRLLRTMAGGSVCPTPSETLTRFGEA